MEHYFSEKQTSELDLKKISVHVFSRDVVLYTAAGIFSKDKLDVGTRLLIDSAVIDDEAHILDLGCGIGVVGVSIKIQYPKTKILMSDVNERAVMISKKNIALHHLKGIAAMQSNIFESIEEKFDTILLNPPQTAGKVVCFKMIEDSFGHLNPGGSLQMVARHKKGGKTLSEKMESVFGNVQDIAKSAGFRVYLSLKD